MDLYEETVHRAVAIKNYLQAFLTLTACVSVFLVWAKVKQLKRKLLM